MAHPDETETRARIDVLWQQMNKGVSKSTLKSILDKRSKESPQASSTNGWMAYLGLAPKKESSPNNVEVVEQPSSPFTASDDVKNLAAAALSAVKDAASLGPSTKGKHEVKEVRDFAGEQIEYKKLVDADSKDVPDKGKAPAGTASAVDSILEQIKKKPKLSVLDKTKMDWGGYKEENKGLEDELDAYKKSSNQYLDKVSFLQRADYREFERERDVRLSSQAKRKPDMREDF
ncbi:hypothetical protein Leryth_025298 [Lithospermum erythrorhizon]|nr:hypothetical protein Leryth_025298 [Lithospermum erythrorhizon]